MMVLKYTLPYQGVLETEGRGPLKHHCTWEWIQRSISIMLMMYYANTLACVEFMEVKINKPVENYNLRLALTSTSTFGGLW